VVPSAPADDPETSLLAVAHHTFPGGRLRRLRRLRPIALLPMSADRIGIVPVPGTLASGSNPYRNLHGRVHPTAFEQTRGASGTGVRSAGIKGRTRATMVKIDQTESHIAFHKLLVP
jgi:hypothetical protein